MQKRCPDDALAASPAGAGHKQELENPILAQYFFDVCASFFYTKDTIAARIIYGV